MRTRLRDWIIIALTLAAVFGVSLGAPDSPPPYRLVQKAQPAISAPEFQPRFRPRPVVNPMAPFDPRRLILYTPPGFK